MPRRQLLGAGASGTAALLVSACGSPLASSGDAGSPGDGDPPPEDTGAGSDSEVSCGACPTAGKVIVLPFAQFPALKQVGGSVLHEVPGYSDPVCQQDFIIVAQPSADEFVAVSAGCTHQCCTVSFSGNGFACPCHGSAFALNGTVTRGPAARPLQKLAVCADACGVTVTIP